jgi:transketolase
MRIENCREVKMGDTASEITSPVGAEKVPWLKHQANLIRFSAMTMTNHSGLGHTGGDLSSSDILATLYLGDILRVDPSNPTWPQRDRFIMSKGHCSGAFYSTLSFKGFFPREMLGTFMEPLSKLNGHPDRNKLPGVEANTGPLGHGIPIAVGAALAARMTKVGGSLRSPETGNCRKVPTGKRP